MNEALDRVKQRKFRPIINDPDLIVNTKGKQEVLKGNKKAAFFWMHSPARLQMNATAKQRAIKLSELMGESVTDITHIRAAVKKGTKTVFIFLTDSDDPEGIELTKNRRGAWANLIEILGPLKLTVEPDHQKSFRVEFSEKTDAVWPALKFDMDKVEESRLTARARKRLKEQQAAAAGTKKDEKKDDKKGDLKGSGTTPDTTAPNDAAAGTAAPEPAPAPEQTPEAESN